jgi:hypothetical protein
MRCTGYVLDSYSLSYRDQVNVICGVNRMGIRSVLCCSPLDNTNTEPLEIPVLAINIRRWLILSL